MKKPLRIDLENALGLRHYLPIYLRIYLHNSPCIDYRIRYRIENLP